MKNLRFSTGSVYLPLLVSIFLAVFLCMRSGEHASAAVLPTGSVTLTSQSAPNCNSGETCQGFTLSCPGAPASIDGWMATGKHSGTAKGLVMFFSGLGGTGWWSNNNTAASLKMQSELRAAGYDTVQIWWKAPGWSGAPDGNHTADHAKLACRGATIIKYVHDTKYAPLNVNHSRGYGGFMVTGNSAGSALISYALAYYGLDNILDVVIPTSGPVFTAIDKACNQVVDSSGTWDIGNWGYIDQAYGYYGQTGPCYRHDSSYTATWQNESIERGNDFYHPSTRIHFIFGADDSDRIILHGKLYKTTLINAHSPMVSDQTVAGMPHAVQDSDSGLAAVKAAILAQAPAEQSSAGGTSTQPGSTSANSSPTSAATTTPPTGSSSPATSSSKPVTTADNPAVKAESSSNTPSITERLAAPVTYIVKPTTPIYMKLLVGAGLVLAAGGIGYLSVQFIRHRHKISGQLTNKLGKPLVASSPRPTVITPSNFDKPRY